MNFAFNQNSWNQVWGLDLIPPDNNKYTRVTCPVLLSAPAVAIMFSLPGAIIDPWRWGGYLSREVNSGLIVGGSNDAKLDNSFKVYVNRLQIITYPQIVNNYTLIFDANYSGDVSLFAWEYTGTID